jgi:hypothetical protein
MRIARLLAQAAAPSDTTGARAWMRRIGDSFPVIAGTGLMAKTRSSGWRLQCAAADRDHARPGDQYARRREV